MNRVALHCCVLADMVCCTPGFNSPIWRNAALFSLALVLYYRLSPTPALKADEEAPVSFITNYLAFHRPEENLFKARNAKHLDLAKAAADDKLLFQEAERPKVRRMRYPGYVIPTFRPGRTLIRCENRSFEQASPNAIVVGSQTDLSDLRIKSEKEDFAIEE